MLTLKSLLAREETIGVVGLGYVGLPLAVHLAAHFRVVGFDLNAKRIGELENGEDRTLEVSTGELNKVDVDYTADPTRLSACRLIIVAVPTPIDGHRNPDLSPLCGASETVGKQMPRGACVVFESTVFPGATEDVCVSILEQKSGLSFGTDFTVGYSPERINPGDKVHTLEKITKIISGSDQQTTRLLAGVYGKVVKAGIHAASSIKVAEAAKVIENTQRDLNIALMNELAMIFDRIGINTREVLKAAGTKWNFLKFTPGLVGGHCIGVDPYYLTFKAESIGYHPEMILAGRRINDHMGKYIAECTVKKLIAQGKQVRDARVAVFGLTFKENVPDLRNTRVVDIIHELEDYGIRVMVHDPLADAGEAEDYYGLKLVDMKLINRVDAVILAVSHDVYNKMGLKRIAERCNGIHALVIDVKGIFSEQEAGELGIDYWQL
ncbi:MAG: nucleotide sugar dehydrogenase [Thermodesulfobacteriota bacterium]|nr:nucleotide sugar dehydrogenase [Thermodesulfobacteriota bacterium]